MKIRSFQTADRQAIVDIYNYYVKETPITFDIEPITIESWSARFRAWEETHPCVVAEEGGKVIGYAGSAQFKERAAYHTTAEVAIYLHPDNTKKGTGSALYQQLIPLLTSYHRLFAGVAQPNPASNALHEKFGFTPIGTLSEVGYKFNRFWDVLWYERRN